jgi:hypothetical protein
VTETREFRADMHVKVLDERVVRRAKARDLDAIVYAPHFTPLPEIERRAATFSDSNLLVVPAREVFTGDWRDRKHVLAVGLRRPIPDFVTLEGALFELRDQGAVTLVPHPDFLTVSLNAADVDRYRSLIDGIEVYNPKFWPHHGRRAAAIAADDGLSTFASSYAHLRGSVGEAWTAFDPPDIEPDADALATRGPTGRSVGEQSPDARSGRERSDGGRPGSTRPATNGVADDGPTGERAANGESTSSESASAWLVDRAWSVRVAAFVAALKEGLGRSTSHLEGVAHRVRCIAEFAHLGYENSLTKARRVLRPQLPATHPGHPLYASRFDDIRVY